MLHVVDADQPERLVTTDRGAAWSLLEESAQTLRSEDDISADPLVKVDDVHNGILDAAEEVGADLIILGPHRRRLRDVFIGTSVERVVRRSRFPLLVAVQTPSASYERTLLALDFDEASKSAARAALAMGIFERTEVIVMHAFDAPAEGMMRRAMDTTEAIDDYVASERGIAIDKLHDLGPRARSPAHRQARGGDDRDARAEHPRERAQRQLPLDRAGTNQRKGFERMLIGSVTEDVIRDAHRDILIVPIDEG